MNEKKEQTTHLIRKEYVANPTKYNAGDIVTVEPKERNHEWIVMGEDDTHLHLLALNNTSQQYSVFKRAENLSILVMVKPAEQPPYSHAGIVNE
jgi:hypothetical protein